MGLITIIVVNKSYQPVKIFICPLNTHWVCFLSTTVVSAGEVTTTGDVDCNRVRRRLSRRSWTKVQVGNKISNFFFFCVNPL